MTTQINKVSQAIIDKFTPKDKFLPREYQDPIIKAIIEHCMESADPAFVYISVGGGKTALYAFAADHVCSKSGRALVLARQGELVEQNSDFAWNAQVNNSVFCSSLNARSTRFPAIYGSEKTVFNGIGLNTPENALANGDLKYPFGYHHDQDGKICYEVKIDLLMIDECHQVNFDNDDCQYMRIIRYFQKVNPKIRIIGGTGSPFRGKEHLIGTFWKKCLYELSTEQLVEWGWLVPPVFGFPKDKGKKYDFSTISVDLDGNKFNDDELEKVTLSDPTLTQEIIQEIVERTHDRLGVIIFCTTKRHCVEASKALPPGSFGIITEATTAKERRRILKASRSGKIKFLLNVGVLSTGYNNPRIDVVCYLRPLDSLVLLIQTMGRGFRIPEKDDDFTKTDCLILDYAEVMERLGPLYENPILEGAVEKKAEGEKRLPQQCPDDNCKHMNSLLARRCNGRHEYDNDYNRSLPAINAKRRLAGQHELTPESKRCEAFFKYNLCGACKEKNDPCARECRNPECKAQLIDPNDRLLNTSYTHSEYKKVLGMKLTPCSGQGLLVTYILEGHEIAKEFFSPFHSNNICKIKWRKEFVKMHVNKCDIQALGKLRTAEALCGSKLIRIPTEITHRIGKAGKSIIRRKNFEAELND